jgi:hypothetical protein
MMSFPVINMQLHAVDDGCQHVSNNQTKTCCANNALRYKQAHLLDGVLSCMTICGCMLSIMAASMFQ